MKSELVGTLRGSSLHALLLIVSKVLARSGYGDVQILDRRSPRQRSRFGGHELRCYTTVGNLPGNVVVKVIRDAIRVRMLDELAGVVRRTNADLGLIVTPYHISRAARSVLDSYGTPRLFAIDGNQLSSLLIKHQIGVRGQQSVDYEFFGGLEEFASQVGRFIHDHRL